MSTPGPAPGPAPASVAGARSRSRSGGRRFPLLDSVRALAALCVLEFHAVGIYGDALSGPVRDLVARMEVGVVVFLVVSGFLLYRPFLAADVAGEPSPLIRAYAWRRVLRIVPAYWVALLLAALIVPYRSVLTLHGVPTYFGFLQIYRSATLAGGDPPAWTLGLEVSFYAMLPLWALAVRRLGGRGPRARLRTHAWAVLGLWLFSVAYKVILFVTGAVPVIPGGPLPALVALPGYLDEFALGMGLAVLSVAADVPAGAAAAGTALAGVARRMTRIVGRRPALAWALAVAAYLLVALGIGLSGDPAQRYAPVQYLVRNVLYGTVAVGLVAPAVLGDGDGGLVRRVLAARWLVWLGLISYGVYIWHAPVLSVLASAHYGASPRSGVVRYLEWGTVPLLCAIALGAASWYLVERPVMSLRRLVAARRPPVSERPGERASVTPPPTG